MIKKILLTTAFAASFSVIAACAETEETNTLETAKAPAQPAASPAEPNKKSSITNVTRLAHGFYMMEGSGGNVGVSIGGDGILVIDSQFERTAADILAEIDKLDGNQELKIDFVLNTHYHGDHTGGNAVMHEHGAHIVAQKNVRTTMQEAAKVAGREANKYALPMLGYHKDMHMHYNGMEFNVYHFAHAHTNGDSVIFVADHNIVHMGDTYFHARFPYIDVRAGGGIDAYIRNMDKVLERVDDDTKIIPGHGPLSNKAELTEMRDNLKIFRTRIVGMMDEGKELDDIIAAKPLADYAHYDWAFINQEKFITSIYESKLK